MKKINWCGFRILALLDSTFLIKIIRKIDHCLNIFNALEERSIFTTAFKIFEVKNINKLYYELKNKWDKFIQELTEDDREYWSAIFVDPDNNKIMIENDSGYYRRNNLI